MNNRLNNFFFFAFSLLLLSCGGNSNSSQGGDAAANTPGTLTGSRTFDNNVWNSQQPEVFTIDITAPDDYYSFDLSVDIDTAVYRYQNVPFYIDIYTPDGAHRHLTPEMRIKQYDRWKGEMRDGYRHITQRIYEYFPFSKAGKQRIEVRQATSQFDLEGIHAIDISIQKADLDIEKMRNQN